MIKIIWLNLKEADGVAIIDALKGKLPEEYFIAAARYSNEKDRLFYLTGKLLIAYHYKQIYQKNIDWSKIHFSSSAKKPYYEGNFKFNISHSGNIIGGAFTADDTEVGLDIQEMIPVSEQEYSFALTEPEYRDVVQSENPLEIFYNYWVLKEAVLKLTGEGLSGDLHNFYFSNLPDENVTLKYKGNTFYAKKIFFPDHKNYSGYVAVQQKYTVVEIQELMFNDLISL